MAEDGFVQMLLEVAGGAVTDERDIELARSAARWADEHGGWQLHLRNSFFIEVDALAFWILANRAQQVLEIRTRLEPGKGGWLTHARHRIAHVGHGLNVLVAEDLLPARFSTIGRRALEDYAEALDRSASKFFQQADSAIDCEYDLDYPRETRIRAATMIQAADQARAFPRAELAVLA